MKQGRLHIAQPLYDFVASEALGGTGLNPEGFWQAFEGIITELGPRNAELLAHRDKLQERIDGWHRSVRAGSRDHDPQAYAAFLRDIGYLRHRTGEKTPETTGVDPEIAEVAGPQLVVPLDNARYALNAANARWGSLYDALYGSDVIDASGGAGVGSDYNPVRGDRVIAAGRAFLDRHFGLDQTRHCWVTKYSVTRGALRAVSGDGTISVLLRPELLAGYTGNPAAPATIMLRLNGLGCELVFDPDHPVGRRDHAGICDIRLESALTTIMDCEDSVAAVDVDDKVTVYRNWLELMRGTLTATFERNGRSIHRSLNGDLDYLDPNGKPVTWPGRSLMLVRTVGPHLMTEAVTCDGAAVPETMLDAMVTALAGRADLDGSSRIGGRTARNSRTGSVYIVKPKLHGPDEVKLACDLFDRVEDGLGLQRHTLKMGIMDEERRTSLGLAACIEHARHRVVFINTGFLDRTGDEIHTGMEAGPMLPKPEMKSATWFEAYESSNVDVGLACGLAGRAQIGKGMWAMPNEMAAMVKTKIGHPLAGASTAWVPSPTAATLHATHYFEVDVAARQRHRAGRAAVNLDDLLAVPTLLADRELGPDEIQKELDNNIQGILGYVVRWVGQGVGCSIVPDMAGVGLMEDLATLRISSQHVANWLHHGLITAEQIHETMRRIANLVDQQNRDDRAYEPMMGDHASSIAYQAAVDLVFDARTEPNGYTERVLRKHRRLQKSHRR